METHVGQATIGNGCGSQLLPNYNSHLMLLLNWELEFNKRKAYLFLPPKKEQVIKKDGKKFEMKNVIERLKF